MLLDPKHEGRFDWLTEQLRRAPAVTPDLISNVIVDACTRLPAVNATRVDQLIEVGAWTDAALALIELELPVWKLRRLIYEEGAWFCSLSRGLNLPVELDDTADASHEVLPLWPSSVRSLKRGAGLALYATQFAGSAPSPADIRLCNLLRQIQLSSCKDNRHATSRALLEFEIFTPSDRPEQRGELGCSGSARPPRRDLRRSCRGA